MLMNLLSQKLISLIRHIIIPDLYNYVAMCFHVSNNIINDILGKRSSSPAMRSSGHLPLQEEQVFTQVLFSK